MERINVALRSQNYLIIVGDHQFCLEAEGRTNPLKTVIDYIRGNPQDCSLEESNNGHDTNTWRCRLRTSWLFTCVDQGSRSPNYLPDNPIINIEKTLGPIDEAC